MILRLIKGSWVETVPQSQWEFQTHRKRTAWPWPNQSTQTLRCFLEAVWLTSPWWWLGTPAWPLPEILKIYVFSWLVSETDHVRAEVYVSGCITAVLFGGNCKLTLRKQSYCPGILLPFAANPNGSLILFTTRRVSRLWSLLGKRFNE